MKKINLAVIVDTLFISFCLFVLSFAVIYCFLSRFASFILAITISFSGGLLSFYLLYKNFKKSQVLGDEKNFVNDLLNQLCFNTDKENSLLIESALLNLKINYHKTKNGFLVINNEFLIYPKINFEGLKESDIIRAFNKLTHGQKALIVFFKCRDEVKTFGTKFGGKILLVNAKSVCALLKKGNALPEIKIKLCLPKKSFSKKLKDILTKKRAKNYFFIGLGFLLFSFFIPFKAYYIFFGSITLILSVITYFFNKPETEKLPF